MKKILFSTTSFDTIDNGPALFANLLYKNLIESEKYDLRFLTEDIKTANPKREKLYKLNLKKNIFNRFLYQFFRVFKYHIEALKIVKNFNYNVLVYNNAFTGVFSTLYLKKPVIVMVNDDNKVAYKNKKLSFKKVYFKFKILFLLEKKAVKNADIVIVNSKYMKSLIADTYNITESKLKILIKGIDLKKYNYKIRDKFNNAVNILFVKADYKRGGLFDLIDAIAAIKENDIKLTIIGPSLSALNSIESYIKEKGLYNFEINGPIHPDKVKTFFNTADIFCVPSYKEALGVANMEAMASGIPVISTNVGGIPEVLDYGKCGWLVEPGNSVELADALKECINDSYKRIEKSKYAYQYVQKFNSNNLVDNFLKIVNEAEN